MTPLLTDRLDEAESDLGGTMWDRWPAELNDLSRLVRGAPPLKYEAMDSRVLAFARWCAVWPGLIERHRLLVERWLTRLYAKPVHCWIVAGHHAGLHSGLTPGAHRAAVWGIYREEDPRPHGLGIGADGVLEYFGTDPLTREVTRIPLPGARESLRETRLMMIFGCNAVPRRREAGRWMQPMGLGWQEWLANGERRPMIAGWNMPKSMPPDTQKGMPGNQQRFATDLFGAKLRKLAQHYGDASFIELFAAPERAHQVAQCWGAACYEAFSDLKPDSRPHPNLWTDCAALTPDRVIWGYNRKYNGKPPKHPPFALDATAPLIRRGTAE